MMAKTGAAPRLAPQDAFEADACEGLNSEPKWLAPKYFYDAAGSALFEQITKLPEYYPTRTELALLTGRGPELAKALGPGCVLIEFGAGSGLKAELLLKSLEAPAGYAAIEISQTALAATAARLAAAFPKLPIRLIEADFSAGEALPQGLPAGRRVGFFPGSTIGNMTPKEAEAFLAARRRMLGPGAAFLAGVDLAKDPAILLPAYDDAAGVTARFNLNLVTRLNRELGAGLDPAGFRHEARWNAAEGRIEMHLVATKAQTARIAGRAIHFRQGESIHTENSYKYEPAQFEALAARAGWRLLRRVTDAQDWFGLFLLAN